MESYTTVPRGRSWPKSNLDQQIDVNSREDYPCVSWSKGGIGKGSDRGTQAVVRRFGYDQGYYRTLDKIKSMLLRTVVSPDMLHGVEAAATTTIKERQLDLA